MLRASRTHKGVPATFVADGRIIARHVDPDSRTRMEVEAAIEALRVGAA